MRIKLLFSVIALLLSGASFAQDADTLFLKTLLQSHPEMFSGILNHQTQNEVQILYTQINRDKDNVPHFKSYSYRLNAKHYFYPASTIKLPTAIFALEKLNSLNKKGLTINSAMMTDSSAARQTKVLTDSTAKDGKPSIAQYIKKILLVSDNDAYNRLYEFVGREEINQKLRHYQLFNSRIMNRLAVGDGGEDAKATNQIRFYNGDQLIYTKPLIFDNNNYPMQLDNMIQGKGYIDRNEKLVMQPFDFRQNNIYSIADQQMVLKRLIFPEVFAREQQFNLTPDQYRFIYKYMSMYPTESDYPAYKKPDYFPAYCKFIFYGGDSTATINPHIRIFNKPGDSYGYDIDNTYIIDFKNKVEFMLAAVVQSNEDGIYNDNKYEYATVCLPFLKNLGHVIYQYELTRPRAVKPDLKKFKFKY